MFRTTSILNRLILVALFAGINLCAGRAYAQEPTPTPNEELIRLQVRTAILEERTKSAEAERDRAKAEREAFEAALPKTQAKPLEGTTTLKDDGAAMESEILAYRSLSQIAASIGEKVKLKVSGKETPRKGELIAIYGEQEVQSLSYYRGVSTELSLIEQNYGNLLATPLPPACPPAVGLIPAAPGLALDAISGFLSSAAAIRSLFNTNTEIIGHNFDIEDVALAAQVTRDLTDRGFEVFYPSVYPPRALALPPYGFTSSTSPADFCNSLRPAGYPEFLITICRIYVLKARAEQRIRNFEGLPADQQKCQGAEKELVVRLRALNQQFEKMISGLSEVDKNSGINALTSLIKAETLQQMLNRPESYVLYLKILKAGGNNKITRNLFKGTKLFHSGGSIVSYILFDRRGQVIVSNTLYNYTGYIKDKNLTESKDKNIGNNLGNP